MKKYTFALIIALLFVGFIGAKVSADPGGRTQLHGYFSNDTSSNHNPAGTCGGSGWSDVLCGGIQTITGSVGGPYTVPTKRQFINFIEGKLGGGDSNAVGAAFIISTMSGLNGPGYGKSVSTSEQNAWEALINQSSVTLGIVKNYSYNWNSAYASDISDDLYYQDSGDSGDSLVFYENGTPAYALQIICANPVGSLAGLTQGNQDPTGEISSVTLECDGTYTVVATFKDSDYSPTEGFIGNSTSDKLRGNQSSPGYTWRGISSAQVTGYWPLRLWVHDYDKDGTAHGYIMVDSFAKSRYTKATGCGGGNPTPTTDCPNGYAGGQAIAANPDVPVSLPNLAPSDGSHGTTLSAYSLSPNSTYYVEKETATVIVSIQDVSSGGSALTNLKPGGTDSIGSATTTMGKTSVDYSPYTTAYPYDANQAQVTYRTNYTETKYQSASSISGYVCNSGDGAPNSNHKCTHTTSYTATCTHYEVRNGICYAGDGYWPKCNTAGDIRSSDGTYCLKASTFTGCPSGGTASNGQCVITTTYNATPYYSWSKVSGPTNKTSANSTARPAGMTACYPRNFTVTGVNVTASKNSNENPSSGSALATATIHFSATSMPGMKSTLRQAYTISGLSFTATTSGQGGLVCVGSGGGNFGASTTSTALDYTASNVSVGAVNCSVVQPAPLGGEVCANFTVVPSGTKVDNNGTITSRSGLVSGSGCSTPVINEPYLKVFGGDVAAGIGFINGASCTSSSTATIATFNTGSNPYGGSGTGLAALSVKPIATGIDEGFASAQGGGVTGSVYLPTGGSPGGPASTLSFGNTDSSGHPSVFGGNYGTSTTNCSPDYASAAPTASAGNSLSGAQNLAGLPSNIYVATGPISLSGAVNTRQHIVIYSNYDVTITGPITFGSAGTVADLPSFSLIVKGANILINPNVNSLAGNYIAQGGTINDCNTAGNIYASCSTKLTVYGSFVAGNIKFYRMGQNGSLRYSATDSGPGSNNASEEFDYSPATWLAQPPASGTPPAYDAVTSLPPVL